MESRIFPDGLKFDIWSKHIYQSGTNDFLFVNISIVREL